MEYGTAIVEGQAFKDEDGLPLVDLVSWGWQPEDKHKTVDEVQAQLGSVRSAGANFLINSGPRPDGSLNPVDVDILSGVDHQGCGD